MIEGRELALLGCDFIPWPDQNADNAVKRACLGPTTGCSDKVAMFAVM